MKLKKSIKMLFVLILVGLVCVLTSCRTYDDKYYFKKFVRDYNVEYLDYEDLVYFYDEDGGWNERDFQYFVFEFEERPTDFIRQFYSVKYPECGFVYSENEEYANSVLKRLESYPEISEEYKLHFDESYIFRRFPMFYFEESKKLYIIRFPF